MRFKFLPQRKEFRFCILGFIIAALIFSAQPVSASISDNLNAYLVNMLESIIAKIDGNRSVTDTVNSRTSSMQSVLNTVNSNVNSVKTSVADMASASGAVKSVQRGTASGNQTITISAVNPSKSIVLLDVALQFPPSTCSIGGCYVTGLTETSLTIDGAKMNYRYTNDWGQTFDAVCNISYSWQVIEFY